MNTYEVENRSLVIMNTTGGKPLTIEADHFTVGPDGIQFHKLELHPFSVTKTEVVAYFPLTYVVVKKGHVKKNED